MAERREREAGESNTGGATNGRFRSTVLLLSTTLRSRVSITTRQSRKDPRTKDRLRKEDGRLRREVREVPTLELRVYGCQELRHRGPGVHHLGQRLELRWLQPDAQQQALPTKEEKTYLLNDEDERTILP